MSIFIDKNLQTGTIIAYIDSFCNCRGSSVVERKPEELRVVGSIPTPGTILRQGYVWHGLYFVAPQSGVRSAS